MGLEVRLHVAHSAGTQTLVFHRLPITVGRDESCECRLEFPFVSRLHATLDIQDGKLVIKDLGSRGGTFLADGERVPTESYVDLEPSGRRFAIGELRFVVEVGLTPPPIGDDDDRRRENDTDLDNVTKEYGDVDPRTLDRSVAARQLARPINDYREARRRLTSALHDTASTLGAAAERRRELVAALLQEFPELALESRTGRDECAEAALDAFKRIAARFVAHVPMPSDPSSVAALGVRVEDALTVLFDAYASLDFAYRCETAGGAEGAPERMGIAAALLDWTRSDTSSARQVVERRFFDVIAHHARLVADVSAGLLHVFEQLSPARIAAAPQARGVFRHRALWNAYVATFEALREAGTATLGPDFSGVVRAFAAAHSERAA